MNTNKNAPTAGEQVQGATIQTKRNGNLNNSITLKGQQLRLAKALLNCPRGKGIKREEADRIAHASNSPDVIFKLRNKGIEIETELVPFVTYDRTVARRGEYYLKPESRAALRLMVEGG